jgi:hypothetical protein
MKPQTLPPKLDAVFDSVQDHPVSIELENEKYILLSQQDFDTALAACAASPEDIKHIAVPRVDKPVTYIIPDQVFNEMIDTHHILRETL